MIAVPASRRHSWDIMIWALMDMTSALTDWEVEFVDAMSMLRNVGSDLSWKQSKTLRKLWEENCA